MTSRHMTSLPSSTDLPCLRLLHHTGSSWLSDSPSMPSCAGCKKFCKTEAGLTKHARVCLTRRSRLSGHKEDGSEGQSGVEGIEDVGAGSWDDDLGMDLSGGGGLPDGDGDCSNVHVYEGAGEQTGCEKGWKCVWLTASLHHRTDLHAR